MKGKLEAQLPYNFTLALAKLITNANIFLNHGNTVNIEEIDNRDYTCDLASLREVELETLAATHYPTAILKMGNE